MDKYEANELSYEIEILTDVDITPVHVNQVDGEGLGDFLLLTDHEAQVLLSEDQQRQLYELLRARFK